MASSGPTSSAIHLAQDVHNDWDVQDVVTPHCGILRRPKQNFHLRAARHQTVTLHTIHTEPFRCGSSGVDGVGDSLNVGQAHVTVRHVSSLEQHCLWAESAQSARRAKHVFDRVYTLPRRIQVRVVACAMNLVLLVVLQEQRGLARVGREHRREREKFRYERAEGVMLEQRVAGRRYAHRVDHERRRGW